MSNLDELLALQVKARTLQGQALGLPLLAQLRHHTAPSRIAGRKVEPLWRRHRGIEIPPATP
jgi:hypothetical protein